ncbi:MAG: DUF3788 domain-containing protein [Bacteroidales bacterium]|nr:DUF3788 domain-containing protein [Bacteroidales bacterium]
MSSGIFAEKLIKPDERMLATVLGKAKTWFDSICLFIKNEYGGVTPEWKFYNQKSGWIFKLLNKKRNVVFITPCEKFFRVVFIFGDKAVDAVLKSELSQSIKNELATATKYAEGRRISIEVKSEADLAVVISLIRIKLA